MNIFYWLILIVFLDPNSIWRRFFYFFSNNFWEHWKKNIFDVCTHCFLFQVFNKHYLECIAKKIMEKTFCFTFFEFSPKSVARRCHNTLFVMILSDRQHKYTYIWLFYQLIYPFHWFCSPLMLKIHHFGGTRCDLGTSRSPKWLKVGKWRRMTPLFKNSHSPSKKLL